ncbi:hypothetical protein AAFF_G00344220 [Aldrovandia affinis]|uniref:Uncharacterized protein n=1 Tax=Aldrovandia affinis TaxID=143900 RepID=A0AAD7SK17_9TELE|nr:hypothetical protein AAFF_G00344220 [Aldrovandia affinis]
MGTLLIRTHFLFSLCCYPDNSTVPIVILVGGASCQNAGQPESDPQSYQHAGVVPGLCNTGPTFIHGQFKDTTSCTKLSSAPRRAKAPGACRRHVRQERGAVTGERNPSAPAISMRL